MDLADEITYFQSSTEPNQLLVSMISIECDNLRDPVNYTNKAGWTGGLRLNWFYERYWSLSRFYLPFNARGKSFIDQFPRETVSIITQSLASLPRDKICHSLLVRRKWWAFTTTSKSLWPLWGGGGVFTSVAFLKLYKLFWY